MKAHLLFRDHDVDLDGPLPWHHDDLVVDLGLSTLLETMARGDRFLFDVSRRVLLCSLTDPACITYRQRVLADCIAHPEPIRRMYDVALGALEDRRSIWSGYGGSYRSPRSTLSGAVSHLEAYVGRLRQLRRIADDHVTRFESEGLGRLVATLQHELSDEYFDEVTAHLKKLRLRAGVLMSARLDRDNSGIDFVLRDTGGTPPSWRRRLGFGPRGRYSFTVPARDDGAVQILEDLGDRGVDLVADAAAQSADHLKSYFTMLRFELGYYVACLNLHDASVAKGLPISFPVPTPAGSPSFACTDLRDPCLALRSIQPVVGNDVDADGMSLVIVTGANSGGKSTFLRSVGIAQLMMHCGLFITARSLRASVVHGVFTHFVREEDPTMRSGRLDEELGRMSQIADHLRPHCLVLFNESFAGTNELEGSEIARQIVRALREARITVFFVTHRFDFAHGFWREGDTATIFLRADRTADGGRSYELAARPPLPTSYGEDLYYRLGAWLEEDRDRARTGRAGEGEGEGGAGEGEGGAGEDRARVEGAGEVDGVRPSS